MLNPDEQYTYLSWPPGIVPGEDLSAYPEWKQDAVPESMRFFRAQLIAMGRDEDAAKLSDDIPAWQLSAMTEPSGRMIGARIPLLVKKGETADWNPATKTYEIRKR